MKKEVNAMSCSFLVRTGSTNTSSTSKITKTTANTKNRSEKAWRVSPEVANPHSRGAINSRDNLINLEAISPKSKNTPPKTMAKRNIIVHNQIAGLILRVPLLSLLSFCHLPGIVTSYTLATRTPWGKHLSGAYDLTCN